MSARPSHRPVGRPSKGNRVPIRTMVPPELKEAVERKAKEQGLTVLDFGALLYAQAVGMSDPHASQQEVLIPSEDLRRSA
jgi:hypothetical protein